MASTRHKKMESELIQAWRMSNEVNLYLLDNIPDEALQDRYAPRTRTVAAQFAHMHAVRLRWLQVAAPELTEGVEPFPKGAEPERKDLRRALETSENAISQYLEECEKTGVVKSWNGPPATMLGYFIAHEAHHRGLTIVALRISGHPIAQEVVYGLWQWGMKRNLR